MTIDIERRITAVHEASHVVFAWSIGVGISEVTIEGDNPSFIPSASGWVRLLASEYAVAVVFSAGSLAQKHFYPDHENGDNVRDVRRLNYLCRDKNRLKGEEFVRRELQNPLTIGKIERMTERLLIEGTIRFK
jgi:hypothetical protein